MSKSRHTGLVVYAGPVQIDAVAFRLLFQQALLDSAALWSPSLFEAAESVRRVIAFILEQRWK